MFFLKEKTTRVEMGPGMLRRVLATSDEMMLAEFTVGKDAEVPQHSHPNDQVGYIVSGRLKLTIGEQSAVCGPGDSYHAPPGVPHSAIALEPTVAIDVFNPPREDYR